MMNMDLNGQISKARELKNLLRAFADAEEVLQASAAAQAALNDLKAAVKPLQDDLASLRAAREAAKAELEGLGHEREEAVRAAADAQANLRKAESEAVQRKNQISVEVSEFKRKAGEEMDEHGDRLAAAHAERVGQMDTEITGLEAKRDALKAEIDAIRAKLG